MTREKGERRGPSSASDLDELAAPVSWQRLVRDAIERATAPKGSRVQSFEEHKENWNAAVIVIDPEHGVRLLTDEEYATLPRIPGRITLEMIAGASWLQPMSREEFLEYCFGKDWKAA